jgi:Na+/proline symporter
MEQVAYFRDIVPKIDWQWMFVVGVFIGGFISAVTSSSFRLKAIPDMWEARFGPDKTRRFVFAFIGGVVIIIGARMAGG